MALKSLNDFTPEDFQQITDMAAVFFTPADISVVMEAQVESFVTLCNTSGNPVHTAYQKGFLESEYEIRKSIVKYAKVGSTPAQTMSIEMIKKCKLKMNES